MTDPAASFDERQTQLMTVLRDRLSTLLSLETILNLRGQVTETWEGQDVQNVLHAESEIAYQLTGEVLYLARELVRMFDTEEQRQIEQDG